MSTLADDLIAVAGRVPRSLPPIQRQFDFVASKIKTAQRFVVSEDARTAIRTLLSSRPTSVQTALPFARLPYPVCWFEWAPPADATPVHAGQSAIKKCGALFEQVGGPNELAFFTAWRFFDDVKHPQQLDEHPELREVATYGCSAIQAGFDFSNFDRPPSLLGKPGWYARTLGINESDIGTLEKIRDDARNGVRFALKNEAEREALIAIERRCCYRVLTEIGGYEMLRIAGRMGGEAWINSSIKDVSDEFGHLVATLILINSKNCVELKPYEPPEKLNKARVKRGQTELLPYSTVEITLNKPAARAVGEASAGEREAMRRHLVRGHFKVRKTGVYWWHHFFRGDESKGVVERKIHIVRSQDDPRGGVR